MKYAHWYYFAALAEDVERTARFVEPVKDNFEAYSIEFARLYLAIGSEINVVAKLLCDKADPTAKLSGINSYRPVILATYPDFPDVEVSLPRGELLLFPWQDWRNGINPQWWRDYNGVKHERDKNFKDANLENTLNALAALLVVIGYFYAEDLRDSRLPPSQNFIQFGTKYYSGSGMGAKGFTTAYRLPGIPISESLRKALKSRG